jgi:alpha-glucosidase
VNVAAQAEDPRSMLSLTRRLLTLRRKRPALRAGDYEPLGKGVPEDCLACVRRHKGWRGCLVALHYSSEMKELRLPDLGKGRVLVSILLDREGAKSLNPLYLHANEGCSVDF